MTLKCYFHRQMSNTDFCNCALCVATDTDTQGVGSVSCSLLSGVSSNLGFGWIQRKMSTCTCLSVRVTSRKLRFILDTSHLCVCNSNLQLFTFTLHESSTFIYSLFVALADTFELMVTTGYE